MRDRPVALPQRVDRDFLGQRPGPFQRALVVLERFIDAADPHEHVPEPRLSDRYVVVIAVVVAVGAGQRLHQRQVICVGGEGAIMVALGQQDIALALIAVPQQSLPDQPLIVLIDQA